MYRNKYEKTNKMRKSMHEKQKILLKYLELRNWEKILGANCVGEKKIVIVFIMPLPG